jgi:two-component system catabolic regulation response regulator CreB
MGAFALDPAGQRIRYDGHLLSLTRYEYRLLSVLLARAGAILSRDQLMDDVWRDAPDTVDRTVDTHIKTVRAKLRQISPDKDPIQTHRGLGYSVKVRE